MKKTIILISGKTQSGKNIFADFLQKKLEKLNLKVKQDFFAKELKDICKNDFKKLSIVLDNIAEEIKANVLVFSDIRQEMLDPSIIKSVENIINKLKIKDDDWYNKKTMITRTILQLVGTDIIKKRVDNNWWVNQVKSRAIASESDVILITDCRFPNEITEMFDENYETIVIRIARNINTQEQIASHQSETALDDWKVWNYIVENNGTLENLQTSALTIINDLTEKKEYDCDGLFTGLKKEELQNLSKIYA